MGYWSIKPKEAPDDMWGDQPADIMADAVEEIMKVFKEDVGRIPTKYEMTEGLKVHLNILDEYEEE